VSFWRNSWLTPAFASALLKERLKEWNDKATLTMDAPEDRFQRRTEKTASESRSPERSFPRLQFAERLFRNVGSSLKDLAIWFWSGASALLTGQGFASFKRPPAGAAWLLAATALLLLSSLWAFSLQEPYPDTDRQPALLSFDWWRYPVEANSSKRLPDCFTSSLVAVHFFDEKKGRIIDAYGYGF
jgi:hypothetical protein